MKNIVAIVLITFGVLSVSVVVGGADNRIKINLAASEKDFILEEMRHYVSTIQQILVVLSEDDMQAVAKIAKSNSLESLSISEKKMKKVLAKKLPKGFQRLEKPIHKMFGNLAKIASSGGSAKQIQKTLGNSMQNCVACHATYSITALNSDKLKPKSLLW